MMASDFRALTKLVSIAPGVVSVHLGEIVPPRIEQHETIRPARRFRSRYLDIREARSLRLQIVGEGLPQSASLLLPIAEVRCDRLQLIDDVLEVLLDRLDGAGVLA